MLLDPIQEQLRRYLKGELSLQQLEEWVVPRLPELFTLAEPAAIELASALELGLAEMSNGSRTEDELYKLLKDALAEHVAL